MRNISKKKKLEDVKKWPFFGIVWSWKIYVEYLRVSTREQKAYHFSEKNNVENESKHENMLMIELI